MTIAKAAEVAKRATCPSRPAGAVLITHDGVEFHGYEGAPHGLAHCFVMGCPIEMGVCQHAVRAEVNAILRCARREVVTIGSTLYVSVPVHDSAIGVIINAGVRQVVCPPVSTRAKSLLDLAGVTLIEETTT